MATESDIQAAAPSWRRAVSNHTQRGRFDLAGESTEVVVPYWVDFAQRSAAFVAIHGVEETVTILGATVTRRVPLKHHEFDWLYADQVEFADQGWDETLGDESHCLVHVTFRPKPYADTGEFPYVEFRGGPAPRILQAPSSTLRTTGGVAPAHDPGAVANGSQFELVAHNLPSIKAALSHLINFQNRANDGLFLDTYPTGCVICDGPTWQASRTAGNIETWTVGIGFRVTEPRYPWNYEVLSNSTIGEVFYNGTGDNDDRRSPLVNFDNIFAF